MPISFKINEAKPIAECHLRRAWLARTSVEFSTQTGSANHPYTLLEPGDVVTSRGYTLRLVDKLEAKGVIQWRAVLDDPGIYPFITALGGSAIEITDAPDGANNPDDGTADDAVDDGSSDDENPDDSAPSDDTAPDDTVDDAIGPDDTTTDDSNDDSSVDDTGVDDTPDDGSVGNNDDDL